MRQRTGAGPSLVVAAANAAPALGSYALLHKLASGGMGTVYVGNKQGLAGFERLVAIKVCHPHLHDDREFVDMFLDEAKLAARIHHPNVVATLDVDCTDFLYLVMEYIEGESLFALLNAAIRAGALPPPDVALRIVVDALRGLHAAHELRGSDGSPLNLVHRDVSPQNILVGVDGVSRITDFGVAFAAARTTVTGDGRIKGKFSYMAPEQLRNQGATRRLDVFAAGVVLWEALACRPLFRRKDDIATINAVLAADVPRPSMINHLPSALDAVVLRALDREPDRRYQSAAEFADALEQLSLEPATTRAVAAYVESLLGPALAERRALVRAASDGGESPFGKEPVSSEIHRRIFATAVSSSIPAGASHAAVVGHAAVSGPDSLDDAPTRFAEPVPATGELAAPAERIEHRRMRGLLAAAMLLLVGSALGLLLARSNDDADAAPPPAPAVAPASVGTGERAQPAVPAREPGR